MLQPPVYPGCQVLFFKTRFLCIVLVDQAGLELGRYACLCFLSAGLKVFTTTVWLKATLIFRKTQNYCLLWFWLTDRVRGSLWMYHDPGQTCPIATTHCHRETRSSERECYRQLPAQLLTTETWTSQVYVV